MLGKCKNMLFEYPTRYLGQSLLQKFRIFFFEPISLVLWTHLLLVYTDVGRL